MYLHRSQTLYKSQDHVFSFMNLLIVTQNQAADDETPSNYWLFGYAQNIAPAHVRSPLKIF